MSRELAVLVLIFLVLANAAVAVLLFSLGLWILGLSNIACALYSVHVLHRIA